MGLLASKGVLHRIAVTPIENIIVLHRIAVTTPTLYTLHIKLQELQVEQLTNLESDLETSTAMELTQVHYLLQL
jgi:hypothetical protein